MNISKLFLHLFFCGHIATLSETLPVPLPPT
jgi:hypothetical protein